MAEQYPIISCICITYNRPKFLHRAIICFIEQNYPNKELVISYPKTDLITKQIIDSFSNLSLNILEVQRKETEPLGNARNLAIDKCHGSYVCMWDDDDWYHASRLSYQYNSMKTSGTGFQASVLSRILLYDSTTKKSYLSFDYTWDGSLLCRKEIIYQNQYAHIEKAEDTHIIKFLDFNKLLYHIEDSPFLYIYIYHGENTWDYKHYEYFLDKSELLNDEVTETIQKLLE